MCLLAYIEEAFLENNPVSRENGDYNTSDDPPTIFNNFWGLGVVGLTATKDYTVYTYLDDLLLMIDNIGAFNVPIHHHGFILACRSSDHQ